MIIRIIIIMRSFPMARGPENELSCICTSEQQHSACRVASKRLRSSLSLFLQCYVPCISASKTFSSAECMSRPISFDFTLLYQRNSQSVVGCSTGCSLESQINNGFSTLRICFPSQQKHSMTVQYTVRVRVPYSGGGLKAFAR